MIVTVLMFEMSSVNVEHVVVFAVICAEKYVATDLWVVLIPFVDGFEDSVHTPHEERED